MTWPFCPQCGTIMDPPETDYVACTACSYKCRFADLGVTEICQEVPQEQSQPGLMMIKRKLEKNRINMQRLKNLVQSVVILNYIFIQCNYVQLMKDKLSFMNVQLVNLNIL